MGAAGPKCLCVVLVLVFVLGLGGWGEGCWEQEKLALLQIKPFFYVQLDPSREINHYPLYDWVEENSDCCQWERVECDATTGRVTGLSLTNPFMDNFLYSYVDREWHLNASLFFPFEELKSLSLSGNFIAGCLHNEGFEKLALKLKKLEVLDLSVNRFNDSSILSSLVEISSLKSLNLSQNKLRELPMKLSGTVEVLDLSRNFFEDSSILSSLAEISSLKSLNLSYNFMRLSMKLSGNIEILDLSGNLLDDNILTSLSELSSLKYLDLSENYIKGSIHNNELKILINLKELHLSGNEIKSLDSFHGLINLEVLTLSFNDLDNIILSYLGPFSKYLKHLSFDYGDFAGTGSIDMKDARRLKSLKGVAADNSVLHLLQQSLSLFPSLKTLHFESKSGIYYANWTVITQSIFQLKNLESLKLYGISLQNNFVQNIGAMTSLKILSLSDCELNCTLSAQDICQLRRLEELDISDNMLKGVLPDCFSSLTFLQHLDLSSNQFCGNLSAISPLQSLTYIDLSNNQFQIPSSLKPFFNHSKLKYFYGDNNNIYEGTELHSIAPRFQLKVVNLSCCGDAGPLPKFLHHQHELQSVDLSNLNLTGEFPSWLLENNTELEMLFLINNSFSGHFRLPFHSPMKLVELDISSNFIEGHISAEIGVYLPSLRILNISKNHLVGSIPSSIGDMKSLEKLDLSNNRLSGVIPENISTGCSFLKTLILSNNRLHGQIFSANFNLTNLSELYLAGNNFIGSIPNSLSNCSSLNEIDIGYNHLSGKIPRWMGNLSLSHISMPRNHIEGPIPGEFCQLDLQVLDLSMNNISETLPSCFGESSINHIQLSNNRLRGPIPNRICHNSRLVTLDLGDNQLTGTIPNCFNNNPDLSYLVLKHNDLEGEIPNQLCQLDKLSLIDLSHNNLSGHIPNCLNVTVYEEVGGDFTGCDLYGQCSVPSLSDMNTSIELTTKNISYYYKGRILRYLSGIDLSSNKLTGDIPHEFGNLHRIVVLNLSHNSLAGPIPPSLSNLKKIESLDLSCNNLSGSIPPQFVELYSLAYFNVSYNNLSGKPPPRTAQFASDFDENSYWGNHFLCGEPLPKNCSTTPNQLPIEGGDKGGLIDMEAFCVTFIVSYTVVLLCITAIMYINLH